MHFLHRLAAIATVLAISGCASNVLVRDVSTDPISLLNDRFDQKHLSGEIRRRLEEAPISQRKYKKLTFAYEINVTKSDGRAEQWAEKEQVFNAGDGYSRGIAKYSRRGFPMDTQLFLSHASGILVLVQNIDMTKEVSEPMSETKEIIALPDLRTLGENATYTQEYVMGPVERIRGATTRKRVCRTGMKYEAQSIHSSLKGKAMDIDCDLYLNNTLSNKSKNAYLFDYDLSIKRTLERSSHVDSYELVDLEIEYLPSPGSP